MMRRRYGGGPHWAEVGDNLKRLRSYGKKSRVRRDWSMISVTHEELTFSIIVRGGRDARGAVFAYKGQLEGG